MSTDWFMRFPFRVLGLGIAVGEALKYVVHPDWSQACSATACAFILTHAAYQAFEARHQYSIVSAMFDTLIFDGFASALLPYLITYHGSRITLACLKESTTVPDVIVTWGPTIMSLCILSVATEPIDSYVNDCMSDSIRKLY